MSRDLGRGRGRGGARSTRAFSDPSGAGNSTRRNSPVVADRPFENSFGGEVGFCTGKKKDFQWMPKDCNPKYSTLKQKLGITNRGGEVGFCTGKREDFQWMPKDCNPKYSPLKQKLGITNRQERLSYGLEDDFSNVKQGINSPAGVGSRSNRSKCLLTSESVHSGSEDSVVADRPFENSFGGEAGFCKGKKKDFRRMPEDCIPKYSLLKQKLGTTNRQERLSHGLEDDFSNVRKSWQGLNSPAGVGSRSNQSKCLLTSESVHSGSEDSVTWRIQSGQLLGCGTADGIKSHDELSKLRISSQQSEAQLPYKSAKQDGPSPRKLPKSSSGCDNPEYSEHFAALHSFDICPPRTSTSVVLKPPLLVKNRDRRNEIKHSMEGQNGTVLRSGMVLLKRHISSSDQVKIVKICRDLGLGPGGFYQPGYRDGAKLHLKMMCLGKNWDPETRLYEDHRPFDGSKPPRIPPEFSKLVEKAINDSHSVICYNSKASNVENILPRMSPNICIVNFYSENGRLGLHQDRDESTESLHKGLPVISFSIGDSADFLYGDQRDVGNAEKVLLESGDVLIFGGKSRHIFHGVTAIHPNTAPKHLLEETNILSGRLNLTFRKS
ncbi:hypothetical protein I3842_02G130900 [Carya illinoinensis]|uniref:DNA N(6)-methyladenine demethylase n=2 Tax=Carya illinoinensis TaxID=32201 RepID=A0A922FVM0_CARIL|nr:hypothetical protein I3842_02G130900 [Carya illinoinensis]